MERYKKQLFFQKYSSLKDTTIKDIDILVQIDEDISLLDFVGLKLELEQALKKHVDVVEYDTIKPLLRETILKEQQVIL